MMSGVTTRSASHPTPGPIAAAVPIAQPISIIVVTGDLDNRAATHLLHWCEARLHLLDVGQADIRHLVVDMSRARRATAYAVAILIMPGPNRFAGTSGSTSWAPG
jgi:hypothetical protein